MIAKIQGKEAVADGLTESFISPWIDYIYFFLHTYYLITHFFVNILSIKPDVACYLVNKVYFLFFIFNK